MTPALESATEEPPAPPTEPRRYRVAVTLFSALVLATVASPLLRHPDEDSFPLSTYPMFSRERPREMVMTNAVGVDAQGQRVPLPPRLSAGHQEVLQSMATLQQAVALGRAASQCVEIAARVAEAGESYVAVEVATFGFDAVAYFEHDRREPDWRSVHARCAVPSAQGGR